MNKIMYEHFLKGGIFKAVFSPEKTDIPFELRMLMGNKVKIYRNYMILPITIKEYCGDYAFNIDGLSSCGYSPERDFKEIKIIDEFIDGISIWKYNHVYRIIYKPESDAYKDLGKNIDKKYGKNRKQDIVVIREYDTKKHDHAMGIVKHCSRIEYKEFKLEFQFHKENFNNNGWETIYNNEKSEKR